jgi:hypothetical protein
MQKGGQAIGRTQPHGRRARASAPTQPADEKSELERHHHLALLAQALDAQGHDVALLQERGAGGFMPMPTPGGVPVVMTSPGISVMNWLT